MWTEYIVFRIRFSERGNEPLGSTQTERFSGYQSDH